LAFHLRCIHMHLTCWLQFSWTADQVILQINATENQPNCYLNYDLFEPWNQHIWLLTWTGDNPCGAGGSSVSGCLCNVLRISSMTWTSSFSSSSKESSLADCGRNFCVLSRDAILSIIAAGDICTINKLKCKSQNSTNLRRPVESPCSRESYIMESTGQGLEEGRLLLLAGVQRYDPRNFFGNWNVREQIFLYTTAEKNEHNEDVILWKVFRVWTAVRYKQWDV